MCPGCGEPGGRVRLRGTDRLYRTTSETFSVVECAGCGLLRLHPQPSASELSRYYPALYWFDPRESLAGRLEERYRRLVLRDHVNFVWRALRGSRAEGPVLDVGCGGGLFLRMLAERGCTPVGLDVSAPAASVAWRSQGVPAICADLLHAPLAPGSCAAITMFHVLEHLHDPAAYLAACHRLLHRDGRLVVQVPNASSWQFRLFGSRWNGIDIPRHLLDFREADLERLLAACGFEAVRRKHFSLRDNPAGLASTIAPDLDPMARRIRGERESASIRLTRDAVYLSLVAASVPFALLEAACGAGSTIMIEARKRG